MTYVRCTVSEGLRPSEITVEVTDQEGRSEFLRVEQDYVKSFDGNSHLPVGIIVFDNERALIELPHEADSGANRLWVARKDVKEVSAKPMVPAT